MLNCNIIQSRDNWIGRHLSNYIISTLSRFSYYNDVFSGISWSKEVIFYSFLKMQRNLYVNQESPKLQSDLSVCQPVVVSQLWWCEWRLGCSVYPLVTVAAAWIQIPGLTIKEMCWEVWLSYKKWKIKENYKQGGSVRYFRQTQTLIYQCWISLTCSWS